MSKDKVVIRRQNEDFKIEEVDNLNLKYLQSKVGGYIELVSWYNQLSDLNIDMWINEEGKSIQGLLPTFIVVDNKDEIKDIIMGDVVFTSFDNEGNTIGLNDIQAQKIKRIFKKTAVLNNGAIVSIMKI